MEEITVNSVMSVLKSERKTGELHPLPSNFYKLLEEKANSYEEGSDERKNLSKLHNLVKDIRIQKLLIYIAYGKDIPKPTPAEEEDLYMQIKKIINRNTGEVRASRIRVTKSIPQIVTPTGAKLGPYEQNQVVYLQEISDVKFMIDNKLGEIVE